MAHRASMAEPEASISARLVCQDLVGEPSRRQSAGILPHARRRQRLGADRFVGPVGLRLGLNDASADVESDRLRTVLGGDLLKAARHLVHSLLALDRQHLSATPKQRPEQAPLAAMLLGQCATLGADISIPGRAAAVAGNLRCAAIAHFHFDRAIGEVETADAGVCFRGAARHVRSVRPVVTRIPSQACCGQ